MKNYAPENAHFKLPFRFDPDRLRADLSKCRKYNFLQNYVPSNYNGRNYILPLRSVNGRMDIPTAKASLEENYQDTEILDECQYFKSASDTFLCEKTAIRLMNLPAGEKVNVHTDYECGYEDGMFRVHIPILTNDDVRFTLNNVVLKMKPGEAWYTNVNLPHGVVNEGPTDRVNLVMDCIRNDWSDQLFASLGYDFTKETAVKEELSRATIIRMIEELSTHNTPATQEYILRLKDEYNID